MKYFVTLMLCLSALSAMAQFPHENPAEDAIRTTNFPKLKPLVMTDIPSAGRATSPSLGSTFGAVAPHCPMSVTSLPKRIVNGLSSSSRPPTTTAWSCAASRETLMVISFSSRRTHGAPTIPIVVSCT